MHAHPPPAAPVAAHRGDVGYQDAPCLDLPPSVSHQEVQSSCLHDILGRLEECAKLIDRALRLEPNSRDARYEHARLLLQRGEAAQAAREAGLEVVMDLCMRATHKRLLAGR